MSRDYAAEIHALAKATPLPLELAGVEPELWAVRPVPSDVGLGYSYRMFGAWTLVLAGRVFASSFGFTPGEAWVTIGDRAIAARNDLVRHVGQFLPPPATDTLAIPTNPGLIADGGELPRPPK